MFRQTMTSLVFLSVSAGTAAAQEATFSDLALAADQIMGKVDSSTALATSLSGYASTGGIAPDGTTTSIQLTSTDVETYNAALSAVQDANYYTAQMVLEEQHELAMTNLSAAVDSLVAATSNFAAVAEVASIASSASTGTVEQQMQAQTMLTSSEYTVTSADVAEYNTAVADVEKYAQEAAGFLAASVNTSMTAAADDWAAQNNVSMANYTSVTYDATSDLLFMSFATEYGGASVSFDSYLAGSFKTVAEIYGNAGIAYGG